MISPARPPLAAAALAFAGATTIATGPTAAQTPADAASSAPVVQIAATDYAFEAPEAIGSGWSTIRFRNDGEEHHFVLFQRLPEGKSYDDYMTDVVEPFDGVWQPLRAGEIGRDDVVPRLVEVLPEWFWNVRQMGGPGLVAPGGTAEVTVMLEPGSYVIECYMKTQEGQFHGVEGMIRPLTVTADGTGGAPPAADLTLTITNEGMELEGEPRAGRRTVAVRFVEHPEGGFPHDAHLARLAEDSDMERVTAWVDWINVDGLVEPAPARFVGGAQEMPAGHTAYVTVDLEPGRYLWVSEASGAAGVRKAFTVR